MISFGGFHSLVLQSLSRGRRLCYRTTVQSIVYRYMSSSSVAYISLGTNLGGSKRIRIIESALSSIRREIGFIDACSCLYESLPGYDVDPRPKEEHDMSMPLHLNAVVRVKTNMADPHQVLNSLQSIEAKHGRDRSNAAVRLHRTLDLDLLLFNQWNSESITVNSETLKLPHPRMAQRNFVLFPLCDIEPNLVHPTEGETVTDLILKSLRRREEVLQGALHSHVNASYTLDGNLAIPRRCFAPNDEELWTVKGSGAAVSDTLRWISEVLQRYGFSKEDEEGQTERKFLKELRSLRVFLEREPQTPRLMGILNVTPDSFSDGNRYNANVNDAVRHAMTMVDEGAQIIDVGGEATNPFVKGEVSVDTELQRVLPVIKAIRKEIGTGAILSVDTRRKPVAEGAVALGADMINDVSGGDADPDLFRFVASRGLPVVIMHSRGSPQTMDDMINYDYVVEDVAQSLAEKAASLMQLGLPRWRLVLDAGLGFAKNPEQCFEILRRLRDFQAHVPSGIPILIGHSRKRFIGSAMNSWRTVQNTSDTGTTAVKDEEMASRDIAGLAVACWSAVNKCVDILRVHDVKKNALVCSVMEKIIGHRPKTAIGVDFYDLFPAARTHHTKPSNKRQLNANNTQYTYG